MCVCTPSQNWLPFCGKPGVCEPPPDYVVPHPVACADPAPPMTAAELERRREEYWREREREVASNPEEGIALAVTCAALGDRNALAAVTYLVRMGIWARRHALPVLDYVESAYSGQLYDKVVDAKRFMPKKDP